MGELRYEPVIRRSRAELETAFRSHDPGVVHDALISAAYWDKNWRWIQGKCLEFANSPQGSVRAAAAYGLGLIAVFHAKLDLDAVIPVLKKLLDDPEAGSIAEDSLADIQHFVVKLKGKHKRRDCRRSGALVIQSTSKGIRAG